MPHVVTTKNFFLQIFLNKMAYLSSFQQKEIKEKLISEAIDLKRLYKDKNSPFIHMSVSHSQVDQKISEGWEVDGAPLKKKTKIKKKKAHGHKFEDDVWCQLYNLGYSTLNFDETLELPFSENPTDKKQIDVLAVNEDSILIVECKSSEKPTKKISFLKDNLESLRLRRDGQIKALKQLFGTEKKIKFILATRNFRIAADSEHSRRLATSKVFHLNDQTFKYVNSLVKNYKQAAQYQFLGLLFRGESINNDRIEIPCVQGNMGKKKYYMFSIEPHLVLKLGFVLHRTKANSEIEDPAYQRLLIPSRLKKITDFIDNGGYFPNSIIVNFNTNKKTKLEFQGSKKSGDSRSKTGILKIPNAYSIAYIIDGQHRVYGYANSQFLKTNTIPIVAFDGLEPREQLEMFMDINQNQKAVSASLRLDLEEDLYWESGKAEERLKALRSSIVKRLNTTDGGPLQNHISIGEDKSFLTFQPFNLALKKSTLLPTAKGNKFAEDSVKHCLYDISDQDYQKEMNRSKKRIVDLINMSYDYVEDNFSHHFDPDKDKGTFILSNRGTEAFICLIGELNKFLSQGSKVDIRTETDYRFSLIQPYLSSLLSSIDNLEPEKRNKYLALLGAGVAIKWLRLFQSLINKKHPDYDPPELKDWRERQDTENQKRAHELVKKIEKKIKHLTLKKLKIIFGEDNWELEISDIKMKCMELAIKENTKRYKEGLSGKETLWTEMFTIVNYKKIVESNWQKKPDDAEDFRTFDEDFGIDTGHGKNKAERLKWMDLLNSHRNTVAHGGSKNEGLNNEEVRFLEKVHSHFYEEAEMTGNP